MSPSDPLVPGPDLPGELIGAGGRVDSPDMELQTPADPLPGLVCLLVEVDPDSIKVEDLGQVLGRDPLGVVIVVACLMERIASDLDLDEPANRLGDIVTFDELNLKAGLLHWPVLGPHGPEGLRARFDGHALRYTDATS